MAAEDPLLTFDLVADVFDLIIFVFAVWRVGRHKGRRVKIYRLIPLTLSETLNRKLDEDEQQYKCQSYTYGYLKAVILSSEVP